MKGIAGAALSLVFLAIAVSHAGYLDELLKKVTPMAESELDTDTIIKGLKEALAVGTDKAVTQVSQVDGYFGNEAIKILMPEKMSSVADMLARVGFQEEVDNFVMSMNRAAEKAAPEAAGLFTDSIRQMSINDAKKILNGGDTAATDYFREKTGKQLGEKFRPRISESMNSVGVARYYKDMMDKYSQIPFAKDVAFDLDEYVTDKSVDGLFHMVAQEEKKIRTDPAARVTDLLKKVFEKQAP
ncbi:MAG: DUF4197 domain-containing protein [Nitrospiraceae bacterium]|nr:MAG: DUF4197 domain-containing protein [Nitrospiraceae bacterium]